MNTLYYDHDPDGQIRPVWLSVNIRDCVMDDREHYLFTDVSKYETCDVSDFYDDLARCSVYLGDLALGCRHGEIGINIDSIRERTGGSIDGIDYFMLLVSDVTELLGIQKSMLS